MALASRSATKPWTEVVWIGAEDTSTAARSMNERDFSPDQWHRLRQRVAETLGIAFDELPDAPNEHFLRVCNDHGADSLDVVELAMEIDDECLGSA